MPQLPLDPASYAEHRRQLWSRRGPNVQTEGDGKLLPCYQHALKKGVPTNPHSAAAAAGGDAPPIATALPMSSRSSAMAAPRSRVLDAMRRGIDAGATEPFYIIDLHAALEKLALWRALLPDVEPFYAYKCNGDAALVYTLANAGVGFDCASEAEIRAVTGLGVSPSRILYANPIKQPSHLKTASSLGVPLTVFDAEHELLKIRDLHPSCGLLLRIATDDSQAQCVLSNKFGAQVKDASALLDAAASLGLTVVGVSFHVGSGGSSSEVAGASFRDAVMRAAAVFDEAEARGTPMSVLDIGGGFPGVDDAQTSFSAIAGALRSALDTHFPRDPSAKRGGVRLIAEPGRFFACATHHLAVSIIGKKVVDTTKGVLTADGPDAAAQATGAEKGAPAAVDVSDAALTSTAAPLPPAASSRTMYYINDGLYGSFNCVLYDHANPGCEVVHAGGDVGDVPTTLGPCSVWGPTCDGIDCVQSETLLPELAVGSWLAFCDMGAYTACAGSNFNGMALPDAVYLQAHVHGGKKPLAPGNAAKEMLRQMGHPGA